MISMIEKRPEDLSWTLKNEQDLGGRREKWKPLQKRLEMVWVQKLGSEARSVANVTEWVAMPRLKASCWETVGDKTDWLKQEKHLY